MVPPRAPRLREVRHGHAGGGASRDRLRLHAQPERQGTQMASLARGIVAVEIGRRVGFRVPSGTASASASSSEQPLDSIRDRTALVVPLRMRDDARDAIAGQAVATARTIGIAPPTAASNRS